MTETAVEEQLEHTAVLEPPDQEHEPELHPARCRHDDCRVSVVFRRLKSGNGFAIMAHEGAGAEPVFSMGSNGDPECPFGHGELVIVSDEESESSDQPQQASLPGVFPPFNYQGAYLELEEKAVEVDRLHREYQTDAEAARESKKRWDKAAELYTKMALTLRDRRRAKVDEGSPISDVDETRCAWEQAHPDASCPTCADSFDKNQSQEHVAEIDAWLLGQSVDSVVGALDSQLMWVDPSIVREWSQEQRDEVEQWAKATVEGSEPRPQRPKVLGTMHVAGIAVIDEPQLCTQCDAVLATNTGLRYESGMLVGTDCPGKPVEAARYPKRKKSAKKGRK